MPNADEQIKALFKKKARQTARLDLLGEVYKFVGTLKEDKEHKGLTKEVQNDVSQALLDVISQLEGGAEAPRPRGSKRTPTQKAVPDAPPKAPIKPRVDLIEFIKKWGHLVFKKVSATNTKGETVIGVVKQQAPPYVLVDVDGELVEVDPETAKVEGK